jgi:hypothetical protein
VPALQLIASAWEAVLSKQPQVCANELVGTLLTFSQSPEPELQRVARKVYVGLLEREYTTKGHFGDCLFWTIDELGKAMAKNAALSQAHLSFFRTDLKAHFDARADLAQAGEQFLSDVEMFLDKLSALERPPAGTELEADKIDALVSVITFLKESSKLDMLVKYVYRLADAHIGYGNFPEAAMALLLHVPMLSYTLTTLPPEHGYPEQTESDRKCALLERIVTLFEQCRLWELAACVNQQLCDARQHATFDFPALLAGHQRQLALFTSIVSDDRPIPNYFLLSFLGNGFADLKSRAFVYKASTLETAEALVGGLKGKFPDATVSLGPDDGSEAKENKKVLVTPLVPSSFEEMQVGFF